MDILWFLAIVSAAKLVMIFVVIGFSEVADRLAEL